MYNQGCIKLHKLPDMPTLAPKLLSLNSTCTGVTSLLHASCRCCDWEAAKCAHGSTNSANRPSVRLPASLVDAMDSDNRDLRELKQSRLDR